MGIGKLYSGELSSKGGSEERLTIQIEQDRLRQFVMAFIANRADTTRLNQEARSKIATGWKKNSLSDSARMAHFVTLPRGLTGRASPHWLIQIDHLAPMMPIGIEVISDVILGISRSQNFSPDFDLGQYGGIDHGVSRRHAMLRPSNHRLYLIDLNSTNGTCINGVQLQPNMPVPLEHGDMISLGALTFSVGIIATPADYEAAQHPR